MSEKQAGIYSNIKNKLPSVSNDQDLTSNSCQQLGCGSLLTLESEINLPLRLSIFGFFSRGYDLIKHLKDLNYTA